MKYARLTVFTTEVKGSRKSRNTWKMKIVMECKEMTKLSCDFMISNGMLPNLHLNFNKERLSATSVGTL